MRLRKWLWICLLFSTPGCTEVSITDQEIEKRKQKILKTLGLITFWDFEYTKDDVWISRKSEPDTSHSFPIFLRQIGDEKYYSTSSWPYTQSESRLQYDTSGPLGHAVRFNKGFIYGAVPRAVFHQTKLDLHGHQAFTMIAWLKFTGKRHLVCGIWDEGGWHKYAGRRQVALFAGLFQQKGVIAHISATGAASYPQSNLEGAQYARIRAIDGRPFDNDRWIAMAMSYDPDKKEVKAYLNGQLTPLKLADPIAMDVFQYTEIPLANPIQFDGPIYSSRSFVLKYNGYSLAADGVSEHRLLVDLNRQYLTYEQVGRNQERDTLEYRILFDIKRDEKSILKKPLVMTVLNGETQKLEMHEQVRKGDLIHTSLECFQAGQWNPIGTALTSRITTGAPFTFGRALGLDSEEIEHGSQLFLDGVAVFDRVLSMQELKHLSFGLAELN